MTTFRGQERSSRAEVVFVGTPEQASRLANGGPPVRCVSDFFEALGVISSAPAAAPVSAVVTEVLTLAEHGANAAHALRRLDPVVRLIAISEEIIDVDRLNGAIDEFDAVLLGPVGAKAINDAIAGDINGVHRAESPTHSAATPERATADPPAPREVVEIDADPSRDRDEEQQTHDDLQAVVEDAKAPTVETPAVRDDSALLGDTDLIEAIVGDGDVGAVALRLIVQQTGWSDVALVRSSQTLDAAPGVDVAYEGRTYGKLTSTRAGGEHLGPWAAWIARWMAMDATYREYRTLSMQDDLTGAWNRRYYSAFMQETLRKAASHRRTVTVMVFDIDDFKQYNDAYGHAAGDEILCEAVRLLRSVIRKGDRVCRIGGDEFVVIFADMEGPRSPGSMPPDTVEKIAKRFQDQIGQMRYPKLASDAPGTLSISGGLSTYPWDGASAEELLECADQRALQSKRKGKNVLTFGPGAPRVTDWNPPEQT